MKVDGFQNIPAILQSMRADKSVRSVTDSGAEGSSSSVSLSSFAEVLQSLQREATRGTAARSVRVERLSQDETAGNLHVDATKLAERLLDLQVIDTQG